MVDPASQPFDPYRRWLGIPPHEQPADHYRLLGITRFESDPEVIQSGADRQMAHVRRYQAGPYGALSQRVLNELSAVRAVLLNPAKKAAYDQTLGAQFGAAAPDAPAAPGSSGTLAFVTPAPVTPASITPAPVTPIPKAEHPKAPSSAGRVPIAAADDKIDYLGASLAEIRVPLGSRRVPKQRRKKKSDNMVPLIAGGALLAIVALGWIVIRLLSAFGGTTSEVASNYAPPVAASAASKGPTSAPPFETAAPAKQEPAGQPATVERPDDKDPDQEKPAAETIAPRADAASNSEATANGASAAGDEAAPPRNDPSNRTPRPEGASSPAAAPVAPAAQVQTTATLPASPATPSTTNPQVENADPSMNAAPTNAAPTNVTSAGVAATNPVAGGAQDGDANAPTMEGEGEIIEPLRRLQEQGTPPTFTAISRDGRFVAWNSKFDLKVYDAKTDQLADFHGADAQLIRGKFSPDSKQLIYFRLGSMMGVNLAAPERAFPVFELPNGLYPAAASNDGRYVAFTANPPVDALRKLQVADIVGKNFVLNLEFPRGLCHFSISPRGKYLVMLHCPYTKNANNTIDAGKCVMNSYDLKTGRSYSVSPDNLQWTSHFVVSDDGKFYALSGNSPGFRVINVVTGVEEQSSEVKSNAQTHGTTLLQFLPDSKHILRGFLSGDIRIIDVERHKCVATLVGYKNPSSSANTTYFDVSADGRHVVCAFTPGGCVLLWRLDAALHAGPPPDLATLAPVPDAAAQAKSLAALKDAFGDDYAKAKKPADKAALAEKLSTQAASTSALADKYMLLAEARDLSRSGGDVANYLRVVAALSQTFAVKAPELVLADLDTLTKTSLTLQARSDLAEGLRSLAEEAASSEDYEAANKLLAAALANARRAKNRDLVKTIAGRQADIKDEEASASVVKAARKKLEQGDDPAVALTVGKHLAFAKSDWEAALPYLAKSNDVGMKEAARLELATPKSPTEELAIADAWHAAAEASTGRDKAKCFSRGAHWYERALPKLDGLERIKAQKRLAEQKALDPK